MTQFGHGLRASVAGELTSGLVLQWCPHLNCRSSTALWKGIVVHPNVEVTSANYSLSFWSFMISCRKLVVMSNRRWPIPILRSSCAFNILREKLCKHLLAQLPPHPLNLSVFPETLVQSTSTEANPWDTSDPSKLLLLWIADVSYWARALAEIFIEGACNWFGVLYRFVWNWTDIAATWRFWRLVVDILMDRICRLSFSL